MSEYEWMKIFANNLRETMFDYNMSQRELAEETGLSESTISRYLNRQAVPSLFAIINIAYALNCDIDDLIDFGARIR